MKAFSAAGSFRLGTWGGLVLVLGLLLLQACEIGGGLCSLDSNCFYPTPVCVEGVCRECRQTSDCKGIGVCKDNKCIADNGELPKEKPTDKNTDSGDEVIPEPDVDKGPELDCKPGTKRTCYGGPKGTEGKGECRSGEQLCSDEGKWGACKDEVQPTKEICDGKDNNCDGKTDEGCLCIPGNSRDCGTDVGECKKGKQDCIDAGKKWGECKNGIEPQKEECDNKDNDCDGAVDEGCDCDPGKQRECGTDTGLCQKGKQTCSPAGKWGACVGEIKPVKDICDGKDNDCDGKVDEDFPNIGNKCTVGKGACLREGVLECKSDGTSGCSRSAGTPIKELCNGKDDDCDGRNDEDWPNLGQPCTNGTGICKASGTIRCNSSRTAAVCDAKPGTASTEVCDGKDNDCDGKVDEDLKRPPCSRQRGVCQGALRTCMGAQGWRDCSTSDYLKLNSAYEVSEKTCDGKDNDCDGAVDETFAERGQACKDASKQGICSNGVRICVNGKLGCQSTQRPVTEICGNAKDDDCDGQVDEKQGCSSVNVAAGITDFAVMRNGNFIVLHPSSKDLKATCYSSSGKVLQPTFTVASAIRVTQFSVKAASGADIVVITWQHQRTSSSSTSSIRSRIYGVNCKPITPEFSWPGREEYRQNFDFDVASNGSFVAAYKTGGLPRLAFYSNSGKQVGNELVFDPQNSLCRGEGYGLHVAVNKSGNGVVTCQRSSSTPIYFRRFKPGAFVDTIPVEVTKSRSNSSSGDSHTVGINPNGDFVIQWQNSREYRDEAVFYDNAGKQKAAIVVGYRSGSNNNGFNFPNQQIRVLLNDFVLRDSFEDLNGETRFYRYANNGRLLATGFTRLVRQSLREMSATPYMTDGKGILANPFDLTVNKGLCSGRPCVCTPGEKRECYSDNGSPRSGCKSGTTTCNSTGTAWSTCVGQVMASPEICNQKDDDCDGRVDEDCKVTGQIATVSAHDIAVSTRGTIVTVRSTSNGLVGSCYTTSGSVRVGAFQIEEYGRTATSPQVKMARDTGMFLVTWYSRSHTSRSAGQLRSRLFNNNCQPVSAVIPWYQEENTITPFDTAISNTGQFALLYRRKADQYLLRLSIYDNKGKPIRTNLLVDGSKRCPASPSYALHVAMNPTNSAGVVTCQGYNNDPVHFRRFNSSAVFVDSDMVQVSGSEKGNSSGSRSHVVGMNGSGAFVIAWLNASLYSYNAAFYDANGKQVRRITYSTRLYRTTDAFYEVYDRVFLMKDDFVFRDADARYNDPLSRYYRYSSTGTLISAAFSRTSDARSFYRFYGDASIGLSSSRTAILLNPLNLKAGAGICSGRLCVCKPLEKRSCYNGGTSVRTPCKSGTQTCSSNGSSWSSCVGEIIPTAEICGNSKDDDCDGQTDESCSSSDTIDLPGVSDYDVASNGTFMSVFWNGKRLVGSCFNNSGKPVTSSILISEEGQYVRFPTVHTSQNGSYRVVTWLQSSSPSFPFHNIYSRVYDSNCRALSNAIRWPAGNSTNSLFDVAIDNNGNLVLAWQDSNREIRLSFLNNRGNYSVTAIQVDGTTKNCRGSNYFRVSLNPAGDRGIVTCQHFYTRPVYYRLFSVSKRAMLGSNSIAFSQTTRNNNSYYWSHLTAMNSLGQFVFLWQNRTTRTFQASFYATSSTGLVKLNKTITISNNMLLNTDAFRRNTYSPNPRILLKGNNFIVRDGGRSGSTVLWYEYNASGTLQRKATWKSSYERNSLRYGNNKTYVLENGRLRVGVVTFQ